MLTRRGKPPVSIRATAIRMLARREHSRAELVQKLVGRGADADEVEHTVADLQVMGLVSDERYAHAVVAQMAGRYAKRAIVHEMRHKSVAADAVATVDDAIADIDDSANALALLERRFPQPAANDREKARHVRFLQSRGFALSLILSLLKERSRIEPGT